MGRPAIIDQRAVCKAYERGQGISAIATAYGYSRGAVRNAVARGECVMRGKGWDYDRFPVVGTEGDQLYRQGTCKECGVPCFGKVKPGANPVPRDLCGDCDSKLL